MNTEYLTIKGAHQNNLKGFDLKIPLNKMTVITGVSGSGKSSLAFDTIYAEGQKRYVETFSSYARQFLDRMERPAVEQIDNLPPAIAVDQSNPVRTSRSTVGTMTEINDHLKLLFSRASYLTCSKCNQPVRRDTAQSSLETLHNQFGRGVQLNITFTVKTPPQFSKNEIKEILNSRGYSRIYNESDDYIEILLDRVTLQPENNDRIIEALEDAFNHSNGESTVYCIQSNSSSTEIIRFSTELHCPDCDIHYNDPSPGMFSFNSPVGACEACRGFGRTIGIDYNLVIPDTSKSILHGAIKPWQTDSYRECRDDCIRFAKTKGIPIDIPWKNLTDKQKKWVLEGEGSWDDGVWYGVDRFFKWLESRSYKMHVRVLLSRYRAYNICTACNGARLKSESLLWKLGNPGYTIHDIMLLPIQQCLDFFAAIKLPHPLDEATELLLQQIQSRLSYLTNVGLGYLNLNRQSRTLSGGEVQRINLTTALGTTLVNTCFILDEPSIGLHSRDINRLIGVLRKLRDTGNTLIIVEHDPELIKAADNIIDMGPGPGDQGGKIVFTGTYNELIKSKASSTAYYLRKNQQISQTPLEINTGKTLNIKGACENNLKNIDVSIPLNLVVCLTGVSGSGKSTFLEDILYKGIRRLKGFQGEAPGKFNQIAGHESFSDIILVDQSSIGKTTRSNPVSYIGAFDSIRTIFAELQGAHLGGFTAGSFSFNTGNGRCPSCRGTGFEHVEMQFLSDMYLRCPECNGKRFRNEILEITFKGKSIFDILEMTVDNALDFFKDHPKVVKCITPLKTVGLGYIQLGQPLPTLSGGEAQRLKLASYITEKSLKGKQSLLFLFDEPTTGLHFSDIAMLLNTFHALTSAGHSVIVIEHNLDVISHSDWIIDIGPEGGDCGGTVVFSGTPSSILKCKKSYTGKALKKFYNKKTSAQLVSEVSARHQLISYNQPPFINISNAREHNLKSVNISIPRDHLTVITGVSGSGKSTIAFDILFEEGRRRYLESLNAYARQFVQPSTRPDVDAITGLPPTVAIEQRTSRGGRKSTVGTVTEIYHYLRLLYGKLGVQYCPDCCVPITTQTPELIFAAILKKYRSKKITLLSPLVHNRKGIYSDLAQWVSIKGYETLRVDGHIVPINPWPKLDRYKEHTIELPVITLHISPSAKKNLKKAVDTALEFGKGVFYVSDDIGNSAMTLYSTQRSCPKCNKGYITPDPRLFSFNSKHGWCPDCFGTGIHFSGFDELQSGEELQWNDGWDGEENICRSCKGKRLRIEALSILFDQKSISDITALSVSDALTYLKNVNIKGHKSEVAKKIISECITRMRFLEQVGLGYITLDRAAPTLSGGEAQRIRLAAQLGSNLRGVCYILDEPTIGLHARDNMRLLDTIKLLIQKNNTVVIVEHDEETIRSADYIIDLGLGGGKTGGNVIAKGTPDQIISNKQSLTGHYLLHPLSHQRKRRNTSKQFKLKVTGASLHNLKSTNVSFPLGALICVTGVSGSGKSTIVRDILFNNLKHYLSNSNYKPFGCKKISGWERISRIVEVDQRPIGKTPRSCPATYTGIMDQIRKIYASLPEAIIRGYKASRFSFNVSQGRCPECEGYGVKKIEMNFLPDVTVMCDVCNGNRFTQETQAVHYKGKSISDVLYMCVDEAVEFFSAHHSIGRVLMMLKNAGLGYLPLGQPSSALSGGEAQRIKLITELSKSQTDSKRNRHRNQTSHTIFVLDEPTVGLHFADIDKLIKILHGLVDSGNTVITIEHNLDLIAESDWIIDLGPEGGTCGGSIVAEGTPEEIIKLSKKSHTAHFLNAMFQSRTVATP